MTTLQQTGLLLFLFVMLMAAFPGVVSGNSLTIQPAVITDCETPGQEPLNLTAGGSLDWAHWREERFT